jgi:hypothetical protein
MTACLLTLFLFGCEPAAILPIPPRPPMEEPDNRHGRRAYAGWWKRRWMQ